MARKRGGLAGIYDRNRGLIQAAAPLAASFGVAGLKKLFSGGQEQGTDIPSLPPSPYDQGTGEAPMAQMEDMVAQPKMPQVDPNRLQMSAIAQQQAAKAATPRPAPRPQGGGLGAAARRVASAAMPPSAAPSALPAQESQILSAFPNMTASPETQFSAMTRGPRPKKAGLIDYLMASNPKLFGQPVASTLGQPRGFNR